MRARIASELISVSLDITGKKPTQLSFDELIDVVEQVINNISDNEIEGTGKIL